MPLSYNAIEHLQHALIESCTRARNVTFLAIARIDGILIFTQILLSNSCAVTN